MVFSGFRRFGNKRILTSDSTIRFLRLPPLSLLVQNIQEFALRERNFVWIISGTGVCASASVKGPETRR